MTDTQYTAIEKNDISETIKLTKKKHYLTGKFLGTIIGLIIGLVISKVALIDVLPVYSHDFKDLKEVVLIVTNEQLKKLDDPKTPNFIIRMIPQSIRQFFGNLLTNIKVKLFFKFKVNPIPLHIKVLGVVIPVFAILISVILCAKIGKNIQKMMWAAGK